MLPTISDASLTDVVRDAGLAIQNSASLQEIGEIGLREGPRAAMLSEARVSSAQRKRNEN
jgi:hypothetical protein